MQLRVDRAELLNELGPMQGVVERKTTIPVLSHILLTARELEPYRIYERTKKELSIESYGNSPQELAKVTSQIYFSGSTESASEK